MLSSFREFVSESIEYISSGEKDTRRSKEEMEERILHRRNATLKGEQRWEEVH
jgi:hypothetical protein